MLNILFQHLEHLLGVGYDMFTFSYNYFIEFFNE